MEARECQLVDVPGIVIVFDSLSMWLLCLGHAARVTRQDTAGQASSGTRARQICLIHAARVSSEGHCWASQQWHPTIGRWKGMPMPLIR
jgi:hypothetical protein